MSQTSELPEGLPDGLPERMPVLPIHFESAVWAFRRGLKFEGRMDQTTLAQEIRPE